MKELLELIRKDVSVIDYFVPSREDIIFMAELEESLSKFEKEFD